MSVGVEVQIDADTIADSLSSDELVEFIIAIDLRAADWDVTLKLCEHFARLAKEHEAEVEEDAHLVVQP